jgi:hypothetical protein
MQSLLWSQAFSPQFWGNCSLSALGKYTAQATEGIVAIAAPVQSFTPPDQAASCPWARLRPLESHALGSCGPVRGVATHGLFRGVFAPWRGQLSAACLPAVPAGSRQLQAWRLFALRTPLLWSLQLVKTPGLP